MVKYHDEAKRNGTLIVSCCGFDSIPADLGVHFAQQEFQKKYGHGSLVSSIEVVLYRYQHLIRFLLTSCAVLVLVFGM